MTLTRPRNQLSIMVRGDKNNRDWAVLIDLDSGIDTVDFGHLDIGDYQVGTRGTYLLDEFPPCRRNTNDLMPQH